MRLISNASVSVQLGKIERTPEPVVVAREHLAIQLTNPVQDKLADYIRENRTDDVQVLQPGIFAGRSLAICGAGPSLRGATPETFAATNDVWACNSALPYLIGQGVSVTAAIGIDQTPGLLREWAGAPDVPDVPYYLASSVDPDLVRYLRAHNRHVSFFHNYVGVDHETALYAKWPSTLMVTMGFSVCSRIIPLALWLGYERIDLHGVDCCFTADDIAHANGEHASDAYHNPAVSVGVVNGREYRTRPDMLMDAVHLARLAGGSMGRVRLVGDTLPVQLLGKPDDYLDLVCKRIAPDPEPHPEHLTAA